MNRKESRKYYEATWPSWNLKNFHTKTAEYTIFKNTNNVFIKIYMLSHITNLKLKRIESHKKYYMAVVCTITSNNNWKKSHGLWF